VLGVVGAFAISNMQLIPVWVDWNHWAPDIGPEIPQWIRTSHHWHGLVWSLTGMVVGAGLTWLARIVSDWALGLEALGLGDVTLMGMIGSFLGWQPVVCVFLIAPLCGVVVALLLRFAQGRRALPYGPCLACAAVVVLFTWRAIWERTRELFGHSGRPRDPDHRGDVGLAGDCPAVSCDSGGPAATVFRSAASPGGESPAGQSVGRHFIAEPAPSVLAPSLSALGRPRNAGRPWSLQEYGYQAHG
jgi:hypothetical protein